MIGKITAIPIVFKIKNVNKKSTKNFDLSLPIIKIISSFSSKFLKSVGYILLWLA